MNTRDKAPNAPPQDTENQPGQKPDYLAYNVTHSRDGKGHFNKIGAAWQHRDGQGYDIQLESLPVNGRVTLRELRDERMQGYEDQRQAQAQAPAKDLSRDPSR